MKMFEYPIILWNLYKMTTKREGGMIKATKEATLGRRYSANFPCYELPFNFNKRGSISYFIHSSDYPYLVNHPNEIHNLCGIFTVAYNWSDSANVGRVLIDDEVPLFLIVGKALPPETSPLATKILSKSVTVFNERYGFKIDYNGFSEGNFLDDDILL